MRTCPVYLAAGPRLPIDNPDSVCRGALHFAGYSLQPQPSVWARAGGTLQRWLCSPCRLCRGCCLKQEEDLARDEAPRVHQATATAERLSRPRRPHAPGSRKSTPEMLTAVRCALSQLQGEPAPTPPDPPEEGQELG